MEIRTVITQIKRQGMLVISIIYLLIICICHVMVRTCFIVTSRGLRVNRYRLTTIDAYRGILSIISAPSDGESNRAVNRNCNDSILIAMLSITECSTINRNTIRQIPVFWKCHSIIFTTEINLKIRERAWYLLIIYLKRTHISILAGIKIIEP